MKTLVLKQKLKSESGQMVAELFVALPAFLITLVVLVNLFAFIAINAKMDKMMNEIVRQIYQIPDAFIGSREALVQRALQKAGSKNLYVNMGYYLAIDEYVDGRIWTKMSVMWTPLSSLPFIRRAPILGQLFKKSKIIYVPSADAKLLL